MKGTGAGRVRHIGPPEDEAVFVLSSSHHEAPIPDADADLTDRRPPIEADILTEVRLGGHGRRVVHHPLVPATVAAGHLTWCERQPLARIEDDRRDVFVEPPPVPVVREDRKAQVPLRHDLGMEAVTA